MSFQQLYYTSCEHGIAGYAGYQFNAVTPGVPAGVLREVEALTAYEAPTPETGTDPRSGTEPQVNLCHAGDETTAIIANVVPAGHDFSGRPGNYFAHALVTGTSAADLGHVLPVELWGAPLWRRTPVEETELPELPGPPPVGTLDRAEIQAFCDADPAAHLLPALLSAVDRTMAGDAPSVLLVGADSAANARWIAAVSYLIGPPGARRMTFTTYCHRPERCLLHVIGTITGVDLGLARAAGGFRGFDTTTATAPDVEIHALARLLTDVGVIFAETLWEQAVTLALGTERTFDDWHPVIAAACGALGLRLGEPDAVALADWLPEAARRLPRSAVAGAVRTVVDVGGRAVTDERLGRLLSMAVDTGADEAVTRLEELMLDRVYWALEHGIAPREAIRPSTEQGRAQAAGRCAQLLRRAGLGTGVVVLEWAGSAGVPIAEEESRRWGTEVFVPAFARGEVPDERLGRYLAVPATRTAVLNWLSGMAESIVRSRLAGPLGELIGDDDVAGRPRLAELRQLAAVHAGRVAPLTALDRILDLRRSHRRPPFLDDGLMARLWPQGCPPGEASELLRLIEQPHDVSADLPAWLGTVVVLRVPDDNAGFDAWLALIEQLSGHVMYGRLNRDARDRVDRLRDTSTRLRAAIHGAPHDEVGPLTELYSGFSFLSPDVRAALVRRLPPVMLTVPLTAAVLRECPDPVFDACCAEARTRLSAPDHPAEQAARLFKAMRDLRIRNGGERADALERTVLVDTLATWPRRDLAAVERALKKISVRLPEVFEVWRKQHAASGATTLTRVVGRFTRGRRD